MEKEKEKNMGVKHSIQLGLFDSVLAAPKHLQCP
jgi:hypothetical protein